MKKTLGTLFICTAVLGFVITNPTSVAAETVKVDRENPLISATNNLIIEKDLKEKPKVTVTTSDKNDVVEHFDDVSKVVPATSFLTEYGCTRITFSNLTKETIVNVDYGYVGTYKGEKIYGVMNYHSMIKKDTGENVLIISDNLFSGYWYLSINQIDTDLKLFYEDGTKVDLEGDSFIGFNSLNGSGKEAPAEETANEYVAYLNQAEGMKTYITDDSNVIEMDNKYSEGKVYAGGSGNFSDRLGLDTFKRNTVSFQVSGSEMKFRIGTLKGSTAVWNSFSSATLFTAVPEEPIKDIVDVENEDSSINGETVGKGQVVTYKVSQKVHTLGVDLLERYSQFSMSDKLPEQVSYEKAWFTGESNADINYDEGAHTVTYAASETFLEEMPLSGETYDLYIQAKVNEDVESTEELVNVASVMIDNSVQETNLVSNPLEVVPVPEPSSEPEPSQTSSSTVTTSSEEPEPKEIPDTALGGTGEVIGISAAVSVIVSLVINFYFSGKKKDE
ncbi:isopeptide-forming domain-containing fimbrial protein [Enterococcus sp. LJL128]